MRIVAAAVMEENSGMILMNVITNVNKMCIRDRHDRQLKVIANRIEKKIKSELLLMLRNEREEYEKFWNNFGLQIKFGVYNDYGMHKDLLQDLLLFYSCLLYTSRCV